MCGFGITSTAATKKKRERELVDATTGRIRAVERGAASLPGRVRRWSGGSLRHRRLSWLSRDRTRISCAGSEMIEWANGHRGRVDRLVLLDREDEIVGAMRRFL